MALTDMDKYEYMKTFISNALEYSRNHSEKAYNSLQRDLQILGVTSDVSIFNPESSIAAEFYVSLHELMSGLESRSNLIWYGISVLHNVCQNPIARHTLVHSYKFAPILTKLLGAHLTQDKRLQVLHLLHQLTFGVKISWQEAHLPHLMTTLIEWIDGNDVEVVELSLGILVNLCHKNLPAVYTLMRSLDHKEFIRRIFKIQHNNANTRVQVCKMLLILQHICKDIPDIAIKDFADISFKSIMDAFKKNDVFLMNHVVEFFDDVTNIEDIREVLLTYDRFTTNTEKLLVLIDDNCSPECVAVIFKFIHSLIKIKVNLNDLYTRIIATSLRWIQKEAACTHSLALIRAVATSTNSDSVSSSGVMEQLARGFDVLLPLLDMGGDEPPLRSDARERLAALFQLLQLLCKTTLLRHKLLTTVEPCTLRNIFKPLLLIECKDGSNLFDADVTNLYVYTLGFMSGIVPHDAQWLGLYVDLLQKKQVQMVLAAALYTGNEDIKKQVLLLTGTTGFPAESLSALAKSMCDLEPVVMLPTGGFKKDAITTSNVDMTPLFSSTQERRLTQFIERMDDALKRNEINNISTSAVMELYEYKVAAVTHSEKALQANLEAASNHSIHLQHRLAQIGVETSRLHQLLFHNQQCLEGVKAEKQALETRLEKVALDMGAAHEKYVVALKEKKQIIAQKDDKLNELNILLTKKDDLLNVAKVEAEKFQQQIVEKNNDIKKLEEKLTGQIAVTEEMKNAAITLESRLSKREKIIQQKDAEISDLVKSCNDLRSKLSTSDMVCKVHEKTIKEKDEDLESTKKQIAELQRVRDAIFEISNPGKCRKIEK